MNPIEVSTEGLQRDSVEVELVRQVQVQNIWTPRTSLEVRSLRVFIGFCGGRGRKDGPRRMREYLITHACAPYSKGKMILFESGALSRTVVNVSPYWTDGTYCNLRRDRGTGLDLGWFTATYRFRRRVLVCTRRITISLNLWVQYKFDTFVSHINFNAPRKLLMT